MAEPAARLSAAASEEVSRMQRKENSMFKSLIAFAPIDVVGSHMAPEAFTGQNGGLNPSSIKKGEKIPRSTVAKSIIGADGSVTVAPGDWQTRTISAAPLAPSPTMHNPNMGRLSGTVPANGRPVTGHARTNEMPAKGRTL
jgi:hypothetical protein